MLPLKNERRFSRELDELYRDREKLDSANEYIDNIVESLRSGHDEQKIRNNLGKGPIMFEGAIEVARSRLSVSGKFTKWNRLWLDSYSASYSTPEIVGLYRAGRLQSSNMVDVGCGAGMQSVFFSKTCSVTSIEVSALRATMTKLNGSVYGHSPDRVINADYANVIENLKVDEETVIFSDPLRPKTESERSLPSLIPSPLVLMKLVSGKTEKFVFDLPPQISWDNLTLEGEKEYISIGGSLNRLTLYQGDLGHSESSAVILPWNVRIRGKPSPSDFMKAGRVGRYLYVPDISLQYARLLNGVKQLGEFSLLVKDRRRFVLTSDNELEWMFPGEAFEVLDTVSESELTGTLKERNCRNAIIRFSVDPEEYYTIRRDMETDLTGEVDLYIFRVDGRYIVCSKIEENLDKPMQTDVMSHVG